MSRSRPIASSYSWRSLPFAIWGGMAVAQQNKDSVKVPDGLALSEFKGYEKWQVIAVSQGGDIIDVIVGNPEMIAAYQSGLSPPRARNFPTASKW